MFFWGILTLLLNTDVVKLKYKSQLLLLERKIVLPGSCPTPTEASADIGGTDSNWRNLRNLFFNFFLFQKNSVKT